MDINIIEQKVFLLKDQFSFDHIQGQIWSKRVDAFGALSKLFLRPKSEEIEISHSEKRLEPFWHVVCRMKLVYDRNRDFKIAPSGEEVESVTIYDKTHPVSRGRESFFAVPGAEHCREEETKSVFVNGMSGKEENLEKYIGFPKDEIKQMEEISQGEVIAVFPEIRASFVIRRVLGEMLKPIQADHILSEEVEISTAHLYFRPTYAFECHWVPKDKKVILEFDGLTGEIKTGGQVLKAALGKLLTREALFDLGVEAVDLVVPGGGLAIKIVQAVASKNKR